MTETLIHRGPDAEGYFFDADCGLGFRRLSIIDIESGHQPMYNEDRSLAMVCNGEIYNYLDLRGMLMEKGHLFQTKCDVEVLLHLYEEYGPECLRLLNGQFAFAIYNIRERSLFLARDHIGINPLYWTVVNGALIFASEIKAILTHPYVSKDVDLTGLDQLLSFPGVISPRTMFKNIHSLQNGHYLMANDGEWRVSEYWDLNYPLESEIRESKSEEEYADRLEELFEESVRLRLQADVPVGFYLSGGVDSSMIAAMIRSLSPETERHSFSIGFSDEQICESRYQLQMAEYVRSVHHQTMIGLPDIDQRLRSVIYHCETPLKETFNTCSLALSERARRSGVKVVLAGDGADELFAGYVGYRFDRSGLRNYRKRDLEFAIEEELRERLWGDKDLFYEIDMYAFRETKLALYSPGVREIFDEFDCTGFDLINKERTRGRHFLHQRSYLDFKLRLSDHLLSEHGDRMALANSVEARYPFLDINLIEYVKDLPPDMKLRGYVDKYLLRKVAERLIPAPIAQREKWGFHAPGSPYLLQGRVPWVEEMLSRERIEREGYFDSDLVEALKRRYSQPGFRLNLPYEQDLLAVVLTFGLFLEVFDIPPFR
jgi:asparagine synthase (glutamine-hydrolysing)